MAMWCVDSFLFKTKIGGIKKAVSESETAFNFFVEITLRQPPLRLQSNCHKREHLIYSQF